MEMLVSSYNPNNKTKGIYDRYGNKVGTVHTSKSSKKKTKRLRYNFKEISSKILKSTTSLTANRVTILARGKVAMLSRMLYTGEYDDTDLEHALIHAKKMVRIAKKRTKHLMEEEKAENTGNCLVEKEEFSNPEASEAEDELELKKQEIEKMMAEYMKQMQDAMKETLEQTIKEVQETAGLDELTEEFTMYAAEELDPEELERLKKKHRSDELREIMDADMKYLKALFDKLAAEKQEGLSGISLQISGIEMPVQAAEVPVTTEGMVIDTTV